MAYTQKDNKYKQHLGLTLTEIGSLLGVSKEAVRIKLLKHAKWRQLAQQRLARIGQLERQLKLIQAQQPSRSHSTLDQHRLGYEHIITHSARCANLFQRLALRDIYAVKHLGVEHIRSQYSIGAKSIEIIERGLEMAGL